MKWARFNPFYRRAFRRTLALCTPLIDGDQTRVIARAMRYDIDLLRRLAKDSPVPFDPQETFGRRLLDWLRHRGTEP